MDIDYSGQMNELIEAIKDLSWEVQRIRKVLEERQ